MSSGSATALEGEEKGALSAPARDSLSAGFAAAGDEGAPPRSEDREGSSDDTREDDDEPLVGQEESEVSEDQKESLRLRRSRWEETPPLESSGPRDAEATEAEADAGSRERRPEARDAYLYASADLSGGFDAYLGAGSSQNAGVSLRLGDRRETVSCPQSLVGRLIGKQGETIKNLQRESGARIQIDQNFPEGQPRTVTVEGEPKCVQLGVELVTNLIGNSPAVGNGAPGRLTTFECPKNLVGRVIGKGGETINELQRRSGARIQIEQRVPEGAPCVIEVQGEDAAVNEAIRLTHEVMNGKRLLLGDTIGAFPVASSGLGVGSYQRQTQRRGQQAPVSHHQQPQGTYPAYNMQAAMQQQPVFMSQYAYAYGGAPGYYASYAPAYAPAYGPAYATYAAHPQQVPWQYQTTSPPQSPSPAPSVATHGDASSTVSDHRQPPSQPAGGSNRSLQSPDYQASRLEINTAWSSHSDGQGHTYWHNTITGESTWNAPPGL